MFFRIFIKMILTLMRETLTAPLGFKDYLAISADMNPQVNQI